MQSNSHSNSSDGSTHEIGCDGSPMPFVKNSSGLKGLEIKQCQSDFNKLTLQRRNSIVQDRNQNLGYMQDDYFYHLGLSKGDAQNFADIRFVCVGGSNSRMTKFSHQTAEKLGLGEDAVNQVGDDKRYVLFKVGPVLVASHGMGGPSISILLHEIAKLLKYAKADAIWMRMGTCGGVGLAPGTVAISTQSVNGALEPYHETIVLGKKIQRPCIFDTEIVEDLRRTAEEMSLPHQLGKTMCCDDFYEGQGRLDGAICNYTIEEKMEFLQTAHQAGVRNIEMESLQFGAFCGQVGVKSAVLCAVLLNRLEGDQVNASMAQLKEYEQRPVDVILEYIKNCQDQKEGPHE